MTKDIDKGLLSMGFIGLITRKIVERPSEDLIMSSARGHNIKTLLSTNS